MDAFYLFYAASEARLPFPDYDRPLWNAVFHSKKARWDASTHSFVFSADDGKDMMRILENRVFIEVDETARIPIVVHNFFEARKVDAESVVKNDRQIFYSAEYSNKFTEALRARKYSAKTVKLYNAVAAGFCRFTNMPPARASLNDAMGYLAYLEKNGAAASSMNVAISALKFFWREVLHSAMLDGITRPRADKNLPAVLSQNEVRRLLASPSNLKHRLLLSLAYSAGLRVAEVVSLKYADIDTERRVVHIRAGKGRKDRYVMLSEKICVLLNDYKLSAPQNAWLFPGYPPSKHLSTRSAQHIFERAAANAAIEKNVSIHSLRHAFATHLLERGVDIRYIQTFMGHASVRTTERYAHVARRKLLAIPSPLDTLDD